MIKTFSLVKKYRTFILFCNIIWDTSSIKIISNYFGKEYMSLTKKITNKLLSHFQYEVSKSNLLKVKYK